MCLKYFQALASVEPGQQSVGSVLQVFNGLIRIRSTHVQLEGEPRICQQLYGCCFPGLLPLCDSLAPSALLGLPFSILNQKVGGLAWLPLYLEPSGWRTRRKKIGKLVAGLVISLLIFWYIYFKELSISSSGLLSPSQCILPCSFIYIQFYVFLRFLYDFLF